MRSMTGFGDAEGAAANGGGGESRWRWDLRSVNGRGLDVKLRLPSGWDGEEAAFRKSLSARFRRGSIQAALTVQDAAARPRLAFDPDGAAAALAAAAAARSAADAAGVTVAPLSVGELLSVRGVLDVDMSAGVAAAGGPGEPLRAAVRGGLDQAISALDQARADEGARLAEAFSALVNEIEALTDAAAEAAAARALRLAERHRTLLSELLETLTARETPLDEARLAQELAQAAIRLDVREEIDRLRSHITEARTLCASEEPSGRKLEFLAQEFGREANTLCAKSQDAALTKVGLAMKVAVDQVREQAANVE